MVSHATAVIAAASCVGLPWFFGYLPHASSEAQVITLLERQLQRCGPENQTCPPCLSQSFCGWSTLITATGLVGFVGGLLAAVTVGSVYLLCSFRRTSPEPSTRVGDTDRDLTGQFDQSSLSPVHRRRGRTALPLAMLYADQVRDL